MIKQRRSGKGSALPAENSKKQRSLPATKEQAVSTITDAQRSAGAWRPRRFLNAAAVIQPLQKNLAGQDATADGIYMALETKLATVQGGDMTVIESMLLSQASSLQSIYSSLARRAVSLEYLKQYQTYFTLALKAQAQSRATLEALIELKQPRIQPTFVKQANIAHGPQQVNNGSGSQSDSRPETDYHAPAEKNETEPSKLLEANHERLDIGAQTAPSRGHQVLEAVGAVNRPAER